MRQVIGLAASVGLIASGAAKAQQKPAPAVQASPPDLYTSGKTLPQLLADGWEFKTGDIGGLGQISVFLTKGHDLAICTSGNRDPKTGQVVPANIYTSCGWTIRP